MGKIIKLDAHTTNLIAAGEVIERAASVVKELVENAIDAQATKININLTDSGLTEIVVQDNGIGMDAVDAKMCVEPHATSKIKTGEDLFRIFTLGFRGEALSSIVSVSNFRIKTSTDGLKGFMYSLRGGEVINEAVIAHPKGTEISVKNLFFNTPARLQNLQGPNVELSYIVDYVNRVALSRPDIAFKLQNNEKTLLQTYGNNKLLEVIYNIYGEEVAKNSIEIFEKNSYFEITGYVCKPTVSRSNRNHVNIIVNNRVIRNSKLIYAVCEAYKERLITGRYPITVINIEVDPSLVDVNIHPAKLEVKFSNEAELLGMITHAIDYALTNASLIVEVEKNVERKPVYQTKNWEIEEDVVEVDEETEEDNNIGYEESNIDFKDDDFFEIKEVDDDVMDVEGEEEMDDDIDVNDINEGILKKRTYEVSDFEEDNDDEVTIYQKETPQEEKPQETFTQEKYDLHNEYKEDTRVNKLPKMYYVGQLHGTYLLFQDEESLYIVDQHAAYERINYEKIANAFKNESTIHYELLIPIKLNFPMSEAILVREKIEDLKKIGLVVEDFGSGTFTVREVPIWFTKGRENEFVEEIISSYINNKNKSKFEFFDDLAKSLACKRSIKANQYLDKIHIDYLMEDLGRCDKPYSCPHGRPTIVKFSSNEIQRWFKRIV